MIEKGRYRYGFRNDYKGVNKKWVCTQWANGCRAYIMTVNDVVTNGNYVHNHQSWDQKPPNVELHRRRDSNTVPRKIKKTMNM